LVQSRPLTSGDMQSTADTRARHTISRLALYSRTATMSDDHTNTDVPSRSPNIYVIGAQSTGKSTLVHALANRFRENTSRDSRNAPRIIQEVARGVLRDHNFTAVDIRASRTRALQLQRLILDAQAQAERQALRSSSWFISDRSAIDPIVYAWLYVSPDAARDLMTLGEWQEMRDRMASASLVVLCEAGVEWLLDDGVRLMPTGEEEWQQMHGLFCRLLEETGVAYVVLPKELKLREERLAFVIERLETQLVVDH
jgi:nicotinamide riboside kinase